MTKGRAARNVKVEEAVHRALSRIDHHLSGSAVMLPRPDHRRACDELLSRARPSVRTFCLFISFYAVVDPTWDFESVPTGARGTHGDKKLCEELNRRSLTLHNGIVAYLENLGTKGNVSSGSIDLKKDNRWGPFLTMLHAASPEERERIADYLAQRFAESRRVAAALPPVGAEVLTFARASVLFHRLLDLPSEGFIQQFTVTALLREHRKRHGIRVITHHPHAADRFVGAAGDIEEKRDDELLRAYEVTVRDDWRNRLSGFGAKMDRFGLRKYVIVASNVRGDPEWGAPASLLVRLEPYGRDIAVVDIHDFVNVFLSELTAEELRGAVNGIDADLRNPRLCKRDDIRTLFAGVVGDWLDEVT